MTIKKKESRRKLKQKIIIFAGWLLVKLLGLSIRFRQVGEEKLGDFPKGYILACWHGQQLMGFYYFRGRGYVILSSRHRDADYSSSIMRRFGWRIVRGSSTRGGARSLIKLLRYLRKGVPVALTPDGPQGPIYHIEAGIVYLAQKTGLPIIPVAFAFQRAKYLDTWDRFVIPYPFTRCIVYFGTPVFVPHCPDEERRQEEKNKVAAALHQANDYARAVIKAR